MNFASIFARPRNQYTFNCRDSAEILSAKIEDIITRETRETIAPASIETRPAVAFAEGRSDIALLASPTSEHPSSTMTGRVLSVRKKDKKENAGAVFRFKVAARSNYLRRLFQPQIIGVVVDNNSSRTVSLQTQLPFLPTRLINWSGNLALLSLFGIFGSFLLIPNPLPVIAVLVKITVVPLLCAWLIGALCEKLINSDVERIATDLARQTGSNKPDTTRLSASAAFFKAIFSWNTLLSFAGLVTILLSAAYLHNWAWNSWCQGKYEDSENLCQHVLHMAEFTLGKDSAGVAGCNYYLAECSRCEGKLDQAKKYYTVALEGLEHTVDPSTTFIADHYRNLGRVEEAQGNYKGALDYYQRALKIYEASPAFGPDCIWVASLLNRISAAELKNGELTKSQDNANRACKIDRTYKWAAGRSVGEDLNDIGVIYARQGNWKLAQKTLYESLKTKKELPALQGYSKAVTLNNLSVVEDKLGNKLVASKMQQESLTLWRKFLGTPADKRNADTLYKEVLKRTKPEYEVPNYDGRSELLISGEGRI